MGNGKLKNGKIKKLKNLKIGKKTCSSYTLQINENMKAESYKVRKMLGGVILNRRTQNTIY